MSQALDPGRLAVPFVLDSEGEAPPEPLAPERRAPDTEPVDDPVAEHGIMSKPIDDPTH